jgi:hypothetical protein
MSKGNQPKREPLLSEDRMAGLIATKTHDLPRYVGGGVRDFYENLIASGELVTKEDHEMSVARAILDHESNQRGTW